MEPTISNKNLLLTVLVLCTIMTSCSTTKPAGWALVLEERAKCGMNVGDIEKIAGRSVIAVDNPSNRKGTHYIGGELSRTMVRLSFRDNKLRWAQIHKISRLMKTTSYPVIHFCK